MGHKFKVGDKGKTMDGQDYEIAFIHETCQAPMAVQVGGWLHTYNLDGSWHHGGGGHPLNLLPPARTVRRKMVNIGNEDVRFCVDGQPIEFDIAGDKIVDVRLAELESNEVDGG